MEALLRAGPHVFVEDLADPWLAPHDERHLRRSLRLSDGDPLTISDGAGAWAPARLSDGARPEVTGHTRHEPTPEPVLTVAVAPPSGGGAADVVQKLTEVGLDRIVLCEADRSVARWDGARAGRLTERLARVAREAAMQSRRVHLPVIEGPVAVSEVVVAGSGVVAADPDGGPMPEGVTTVLVGPEGGWSPQESAELRRTMNLGPHVMRVETAAVVAGCLLLAAHRRF